MSIVKATYFFCVRLFADDQERTLLLTMAGRDLDVDFIFYKNMFYKNIEADSLLCNFFFNILRINPRLRFCKE